MTDESCKLPIDGVLDLHTFLPREVKELIPEYLAECRRLGIVQIRIIHGKGKGEMRRLVHAVLERNEMVRHFRMAPENAGGWGATLVDLKDLKAGED